MTYSWLEMRLARTAQLIVLFAIVAGPAYALQCGDVLTADTVLTADLGPCPGDGLVIRDQPGITLNLNGHRIIGTGNGAGVLLDGRRFDVGPVTIQGPGVIASFAVGVSSIRDIVNNITIQDVTLMGNTSVQIGISKSSNLVIKNNQLLGFGNSVWGIYLVEISRARLEENTIIGHAEAGIYGALAGQVSIVHNNIRNNGIGMKNWSDPGTWIIQENNVSFNRGDGIWAPRCQLIEGNRAGHNGGSGITTRGVPASGCSIRENSVMHNALYGIALIDEGDSRVIGNQALHNGVDLFWDGARTGNCWSNNLFKTSDPAVLPPCQ